MKTFALICMIIGMGTLNAQQSENGTLIIAKIEGQVKFYQPDGTELPANTYKEGDTLPIGVSAETGQGASMLGILSNGTLMTMRENTRMKIGEFKQAPFDPGNQKLSDLQEEPSTSDVTIDLDVGSLIIKTKKLNVVNVLSRLRNSLMVMPAHMSVHLTLVQMVCKLPVYLRFFPRCCSCAYASI